MAFQGRMALVLRDDEFSLIYLSQEPTEIDDITEAIGNPLSLQKVDKWYDNELSLENSGPLARSILEAMASHEDLEPVVKKATDELVDETLDLGILTTSFIGVLLTLAAYSALGILMSALTNSPATAAFSTLAVLLVLWITEMLAESGISWLDSGIVYLSIFQHLSPMLRGLLDTRDVMYFLILIVGFLSLATQQLYSKRI